jgi:hypothetical protein
VASGLTAAVIAVPGVAFAEETAPADPVTSVLDEVAGQVTPGDLTEESPMDPITAPITGEPDDTDPDDTAPEGEQTPPPFVVPAELEALFAQAASPRSASTA